MRSGVIVIEGSSGVIERRDWRNNTALLLSLLFCCCFFYFIFLRDVGETGRHTVRQLVGIDVETYSGGEQASFWAICLLGGGFRTMLARFFHTTTVGFLPSVLGYACLAGKSQWCQLQLHKLVCKNINILRKSSVLLLGRHNVDTPTNANANRFVQCAAWV